MRREDFMFTDYDELEIIAQRCDVGYLGIHDPDGYPRVIPLNFHLMNPCIYFHGAEVVKRVYLQLPHPISISASGRRPLSPLFGLSICSVIRGILAPVGMAAAFGIFPDHPFVFRLWSGFVFMFGWFIHRTRSAFLLQWQGILCIFLNHPTRTSRNQNGNRINANQRE
ncbi:MAG: pyridoxamine 5'-phosphate oxidase family protein [bacterium]